MNTEVHNSTKQTPYELGFGQPPRTIFTPAVNFRGQLNEKPCDRESSEEAKKNKEEDDEEEWENE